jgi:hypothetical protein
VVTYMTNRSRAPAGHDSVGRRAVAERLAETLGAHYRRRLTTRRALPGTPYFVPDDALTHARASRSGIASADDLFGGVVPHAFVATKAITHGVRDPDARAPDGWSHAFNARVEGAVLRGLPRSRATTRWPRCASSSTRRRAASSAATASAAGASRWSRSVDEAAQVLDAIDDATLADTGIVVEENLRDVTTYSVGLVAAGGMTLSYCGTQRTVRNGMGHDVYGGSTLACVRGGFEALSTLDLPDDARKAVALRAGTTRPRSRRTDGCSRRAATTTSRRARPRTARRASACSSSRGAWAARAAPRCRALEAFSADPGCASVRASTVETYRAHPRIPTMRSSISAASTCTARAGKYATLTTDADA